MSNDSDRHRRYWRANVRFIGLCLAAWALVSIVLSILLVAPLNRLSFFSLPLGFWVAQQGAMIFFVILIFVYARRMDKLDHNYHEDE